MTQYASQQVEFYSTKSKSKTTLCHNGIIKKILVYMKSNFLTSEDYYLQRHENDVGRAAIEFLI